MAVLAALLVPACGRRDNPIFASDPSTSGLPQGAEGGNATAGTSTTSRGTTLVASSTGDADDAGETTVSETTGGPPADVDLPAEVVWPPTPVCTGVTLEAPLCDPLDDTCEDGLLCGPGPNNFEMQCRTDVSGGETLPVGSPCAHPLDCGPQMACITANALEVCDTPAGTGCCMRYCNVTEHNCLDGRECLLIFQTPPHPCLGALGLCADP